MECKKYFRSLNNRFKLYNSTGPHFAQEMLLKTNFLYLIHFEIWDTIVKCYGIVEFGNTLNLYVEVFKLQ